MIIDTNAHLGNWPFRKLAHSDAGGLVQLMDDHGLTQAWVGPFEGVFYRDCGQANRDLLTAISGHADRLVPWAAINPNFPGGEDDLAEAGERGMAGVRLYPNYHGYTLLDECALELLAQVQQRGLPVAIYHKLVDERLHHWHCKVPPTEMTIGPLAERLPDLTIVCCGVSLPVATQLQQTTRVLVETSRIEGAGGVGSLVAALGPERVLFGSHAPYFYIDAGLLKLVESGLPEDQRQALLYGNACRIV